jgi:hypothetical protein
MPAQSLSGPSSAELVIIIYFLVRDFHNLQGQVPAFISLGNRVALLYLRELDSLFIAFYVTQGYGRGAVF